MNREEIINAIEWELDPTGKEDVGKKAEHILNLCAEYYGYVNGKLARLEKKIHEKIEQYESSYPLTLDQFSANEVIEDLKSLLENDKKC